MGRPRRITRISDPVHRMQGYLVTATIDQRLITRFYSDYAHGSAEDAAKLAECVVERSIDEHLTYLALKRRFKLRRNTPAGITGVCRVPSDVAQTRAFWLARWFDDQNRRRSRKFSVAKYGENSAREMALRARLGATEGERGSYAALEKSLKNFSFEDE